MRSLGMAQTLLRPEQVDDLVAQYREGATLVELASRFGVNRRTVAMHLTRREVTIRRGRFDPSRIHEAAEGKLSAWKVTRLHTMMHTEFPQEYWASDGVRQLVVTTCADYDPKKGFYTKNIFAVATPVDPDTGQPMPEPEIESDEQSELTPPKTQS